MKRRVSFHSFCLPIRFGNKSFYAEYKTFELGSEADGYRLKLGNWTGNAGNAMTDDGKPWNQNGRMFTTFDRDNDVAPNENCAASYKGGFWFGNCHLANLNGLIPTGIAHDAKYMSWKTINGYYGGVYFSEMKIKHN